MFVEVMWYFWGLLVCRECVSCATTVATIGTPASNVGHRARDGIS